MIWLSWGLFRVGAESYALMSVFDFPGTRILPCGGRLVKIYSLCMALETVVRTDGYHALIRGLVTA